MRENTEHKDHHGRDETRDSYVKRNKQSTIPTALVKERNRDKTGTNTEDTNTTKTRVSERQKRKDQLRGNNTKGKRLRFLRKTKLDTFT